MPLDGARTKKVAGGGSFGAIRHIASDPRRLRGHGSLVQVSARSMAPITPAIPRSKVLKT